MNTNYAPPAELKKFEGVAFGIGLIGLIAWAVSLSVSGHLTDNLFRSYLVAYVFWVGISLGSLGLLMVQYLGGGGWGLVIRRLLEAGSHTLVLMAVLFLPILGGLGKLYEWVHPEHVTHETAKKLIAHKAPYLNVPFFTGRVVLYFLIWIGLAMLLRKFSKQQDDNADMGAVQRAQNWSGPGFVVYAMAVSFAAFDWIMSLDVEWFSTIFGMLTLAGQGVLTIAFLIIVCTMLQKTEPMSHVLQPKHFHDLGKLQLALVMVWAYFSFSQLLIIWSGNLPEEIPWYLERFQGIWRYIGIALIILHFALPFVLLLSRDLKRDARRLKYVALLLILMRFVDLVWVMVPEFVNRHVEGAAHESHTMLYVACALATIGLGGLWTGWFFMLMRRRAMVPYNDPQLSEALAAGGHH
ncbi:MAG: hypothetical protein SF339_19830 [Blastocatellia bacterium]|nr:hypothetical protein [Blastocatellia bacterium]